MRARIGVLALVAVAVACDVQLPRPGPRELPSPARSDFRSKQIGERWEFWPRSARVETGVEYAFDAGHCGLSFLTDFDGTFWDPVNPNPNPGGEPPEFFYNEDHGTMTLHSTDVAFYVSSRGLRVRLTRVDGPVILKKLCA